MRWKWVLELIPVYRLQAKTVCNQLSL